MFAEKSLLIRNLQIWYLKEQFFYRKTVPNQLGRMIHKLRRHYQERSSYSKIIRNTWSTVQHCLRTFNRCSQNKLSSFKKYDISTELTLTVWHRKAVLVNGNHKVSRSCKVGFWTCFFNISIKYLENIITVTGKS